MPAAAALEGSVFQHQTVVLGFGLSLDALAMGGGHGVDVLAHAGGAHEGHATHPRIGEEEFGFVTAAGDQVDHALGQAGFVEKLEQTDARGGDHAGGLEDQGVAGDDAQRQHPAEGDHGREVEGGDAGEDAQRLAVAHGVVAGGHVHEGLALGEHGSGHAHFAALDDLDDLAPGFVQVLAQLAGAHVGKFILVLLEEGLPVEQHLGALLDGKIGPGLRRPCGRRR